MMHRAFGRRRAVAWHQSGRSCGHPQMYPEKAADAVSMGSVMASYLTAQKLARTFSAMAILGAILIVVAVTFGPIAGWLDAEETTFVLAAGCGGLLVGVWLRWRTQRVLDRLK